MHNWLVSIYHRLPIVRELRAQALAAARIEQLLRADVYHAQEITQSLRFFKTAAMIQAIEAIKASDPRYRDRLRLMAHGEKYWSQNFEDGMIAEIFKRIGTTSKTCVEIGVGDGAENNTTALLAQGWRGWWIEANPQSCDFIRSHLKQMPNLASRLKLTEAFVFPDNIEEIFQTNKVPTEVDLFSLDIDQDTYHIWARLKNFHPRVVVVEYNAGIPPSQSWVHPYEREKSWDYTQAFGASLKAFELLGQEYGYSLVGCDIVGVNAFFVRNDLIEDKFSAPFSAENHFEPCRYGLVFRWGHKSRLFGEANSHGQV